jgi:hypothetical protein
MIGIQPGRQWASFRMTGSAPAGAPPNACSVWREHIDLYTSMIADTGSKAL